MSITLREAEFIDGKCHKFYYSKLYNIEQTYFNVFVAQHKGKLFGGRKYIAGDDTVSQDITDKSMPYNTAKDAVLVGIRNVYSLAKKNNVSEHILEYIIHQGQIATNALHDAAVLEHFTLIEHVPEPGKKKSKAKPKAKPVKINTIAGGSLSVAQAYAQYDEPKKAKCVNALPFSNILTVDREYDIVGQHTMLLHGKETIIYHVQTGPSTVLPFSEDRFQLL